LKVESVIFSFTRYLLFHRGHNDIGQDLLHHERIFRLLVIVWGVLYFFGGPVEPRFSGLGPFNQFHATKTTKILYDFMMHKTNPGALISKIKPNRVKSINFMFPWQSPRHMEALNITCIGVPHKLPRNACRENASNTSHTDGRTDSPRICRRPEVTPFSCDYYSEGVQQKMGHCSA
jgi:hypothetical protein